MIAERTIAGTLALAAAGLALLLAERPLGLLLLALALGGWIHGAAAVGHWASAAGRGMRGASRGFGSARYVTTVALAFWGVGLALVLVPSRVWETFGDDAVFWVWLTGVSLVVSGWLHGCLAAASWADTRSQPTSTGVAHTTFSATLVVLAVAVVGPIVSAIALAYAFGIEPGFQPD